MITLLGSLLGFASSLLPDVFRFFHDKHDKAHELALFDRQLQMLSLKHLSRVQEADIMRETLEQQALYQHARPLGIKWVDALSGSVRPVITYTFFFLYAALKIAQAAALQEASLSLIYLWHEEDQALFAAVMGFWFGQRALMRNRRS